MDMVRRWTGHESRALRQAMRLSVRDFAAKLGVAARTVTKWEAEGIRAQLRPDSHALLDTAYHHADDQTQARYAALLAQDAVRQVTEDASRDRRGPNHAVLSGRTVEVEADRLPVLLGLSGRERTDELKGEDVRRRSLLEYAALGIAGAAGPLVALEALRHDLVQAVAGDAAASLEEWEAVAWDYGYTYAVTPPATLLDDLGIDLLVARGQLGHMTDPLSQRGMQRVIAVLEAFLAQTLGNLGHVQAGRRWWRTARATADKSQDAEIRTWVRGREVIRGLYEQWPSTLVLEHAEEAAAVDASPGMGSATVLIGRAQALAAMGRSAEAKSAMTAVYDVVDRLPDRVTADVTSMYGWPEYRLRHGESFVYTHLGDNRRAAAAQDRALALYPAHMFRERAQVQLHQAVRMVHGGDPTAGAAHARQVVGELPEKQRIKVVLEAAKSVVRAVPEAEQRRPEVVALREMLALPALPHGR